MYRLAREQLQSAVARTQRWTGALTPWASEALESIRRDIQLDGRMETPPTIRFYPSGRADVIETKTRHTFTCEVRTRKCSCQTRDIFAVPCRHLVFVADYLRCPSGLLFAECYRTNYWNEMLNSTTFPHLNINLGQLTAPNSFLPAIYGKTRGRPAKKKISTHPGIRKPRSATDNINSTDDNLDPESFWSQFEHRSSETDASSGFAVNSAPTLADSFSSLLDESTQLEFARFLSLKENSEIEDQRRRMETRLSSFGLLEHLVNVPGDGNCLFSSLGSLTGTAHEHVRHQLVAWLRDNATYVTLSGEPLSAFIDSGSWSQFCQRMSQPKEWGDHVVLFAAAEVYQSDIIIISSVLGDQFVINIQPQEKPAIQKPPLLLAHWHESHYQPISPTPSPQALSSLIHPPIPSITDDVDLLPNTEPTLPVDSVQNQATDSTLPVDSIQNQATDSTLHQIQFIGMIKLPPRGTVFPSPATDPEKNPLTVPCVRCNQPLQLFYSTVKQYDLFAKCTACQIEYQKEGRATTRLGQQCVQLVERRPRPFPPQIRQRFRTPSHW